MAAAHIVPNSESTEAPLLVVPLVGVTSGKGSLNVYGQNKMRLVNESDSDPLVVRRGMMLAGFGRGKWAVKDDKFNEETMLLYRLSDSSDDVLSNGQDVAPVLDIALEKRKTMPDCRVAFFDIVPKGDGPAGSFALVPTAEVVFIPSIQAGNEATGHLQTRMAAQIPMPI